VLTGVTGALLDGFYAADISCSHMGNHMTGKQPKTEEIGIRELKARASELVRAVKEERARYVVTRRGKPAALIIPLDAAPPERTGDQAWERLIHMGGKIKQGLEKTIKRGRDPRGDSPMNSPVTIDASVFVSAFLPRESAHQASREFMLSIHRRSVPVIVPFLVLPEISATLARGHGKPEAAIAFVRELGNLRMSLLWIWMKTLPISRLISQRITASEAMMRSMAPCSAIRNGIDYSGQRATG